MLDMLVSCYKLKALKRTGWVMNKVNDCETVASHCYGTALLCLVFAQQCGVDQDKALKMCLLHDLQESMVGDFTPYCKITEEEKHNREIQAMTQIGDALSKPEFKDLLSEFEEEKTPEAKFVKDLDKLDMLLQAYIYEKEQNVDLSSFFNNCTYPKTYQTLIDFRNSIESQRKK